MSNWNRSAKVNVKVLAVLILVVVALGTSLFAAREIRRGILSKMDLDAGQQAYEKQDWPTASKHFQRYLGRNSDDLEVLKKYAEARLSVRPLDAGAVSGAIAAYRRILQLDPLNEVAYKKLAQLYAGIGNFEELAYIAGMCRTQFPAHREAPLWYAEALFRLRKTNDARKALGTYIQELESLAEKPAEYVQACALMSQIVGSPGVGTSSEALQWLNKAVTSCPASPEALAHRARFYRQRQDIRDMNGVADMNEVVRLGLAHKDLEAADAMSIESPRIRLFLAAEWLEHDELDRAEAQLKAVENLPPQALQEQFFDLRDWTVTRFLFASQLAIKRKTAPEGAALADEVLSTLNEKGYRLRVLPSAIALYVAAGQVEQARDGLDEYLENLYTQEGAAESKLALAYLKALVARAEKQPYKVIDALQPAVVTDPSRPELWRLLAEAFSRTDQPRRAVGALVKYLLIKPRDPEMTLQLAKEYLRLRDWNRAYETARLGEPLDPTDIVIRLLRIEASIYRAAETSYRIDPASLEPSSAQLALLRQEHPDRVDIRLLQAVIADYLGQTGQAEKELKLAIEQCPDPLRAEMQLVWYYYRDKRMAEARAVCEKACARSPQVAEPWLRLAGLYGAKAEYEGARSALERGLQAVTEPWERRSLSIQMGLLEILYGERTKGIGLLRTLADNDLQEIRARSLLLNIREVQQNSELTQKLIDELKMAEGETGLLWRFYQAALWLAADDWRSRQPSITEAVQYCIQADPQWSQPALLLANMYEKLEDFPRMEETCRQALQRNPSATDVADALIGLLERQRRYTDAEKLLTQVETNPRLTSDWSVRMALNAGDYSRAIEELKLRVAGDDRDANSRILLARLTYWQTGQAEPAFELLREAEAISADSMALVAAKMSILRAQGKSEEAQNVLDAYVVKSNTFAAYATRAAYLASLGQLERAEQDYRKLLSFTTQESVGYELLSNFYARTQRLDQAVTTLKEGLAKDPNDLGMTRRLMKTLFLRNQGQDPQNALKILAALQQKLPQDPELMKIEAVQILQAQPPDYLATARKKLQSVVALEPTAVDAHLALIRIAVQEKQYASARDAATRALGANPDNPALLAARAGAELLLENTPMAGQLAQLALQKDPNNIQARDVLTAVALTNQDLPLLGQVRPLLDSALSSDPNNEPLLIARTRVLVSLQLPQTALPEVAAYCQTPKGRLSISALVTLADLYRLTGDMDRAQQTIDQAEQIDGRSLMVIHARFLWRVAQRQFDELTQISSAYLSAKEQNATTFVAAATILSGLDSPELKKEALKLFEQAVTLDPKSREARLGLASILYQTAERDRALTLYQQVLADYPSDKQALNDLAWILQEHRRQYEAALELANRGLILWPDEPHLLDTRGTILTNMGNRLDDARRDFERLVQVAPADSPQKADALLKLGRLCVRLDDAAQARRHLQAALEIDRKSNVFTADERSEITKILQAGGAQAANR